MDCWILLKLNGFLLSAYLSFPSFSVSFAAVRLRPFWRGWYQIFIEPMGYPSPHWPIWRWAFIWGSAFSSFACAFVLLILLAVCCFLFSFCDFHFALFILHFWFALGTVYHQMTVYMLVSNLVWWRQTAKYIDKRCVYLPKDWYFCLYSPKISTSPFKHNPVWQGRRPDFSHL